jgi:hypothetical protein
MWLDLEDDAMQAIKTYAEDYDLSLGKAASELIRRGVRYRVPIVRYNGLAVFEPPPGEFPTITTERVLQLLDVSVLLALVWTTHQHYRAAHA